MHPGRLVDGGLDRENKQKGKAWGFFRPDNKPVHRFSPKQDKLNRNSYQETQRNHWKWKSEGIKSQPANKTQIPFKECQIDWQLSSQKQKLKPKKTKQNKTKKTHHGMVSSKYQKN